MDVVAEISALGELMSPNEVIAALTKNAAAYLDLSDSIGTLEPGKIADIVVIDGDPLANVLAGAGPMKRARSRMTDCRERFRSRPFACSKN